MRDGKVGKPMGNVALNLLDGAFEPVAHDDARTVAGETESVVGIGVNANEFLAFLYGSEQSSHGFGVSSGEKVERITGFRPPGPMQVNRVVEYQPLSPTLFDERVEGRANVEFSFGRQCGVLRLFKAEGAERIFIEADQVRLGRQSAGNTLHFLRGVES